MNGNSFPVSPRIKAKLLSGWVGTWDQPWFSCPATAYTEAHVDDKGARAIRSPVLLIAAFLTCVTSAPKTLPSKNNLIQNVTGRVPLALCFLCNTFFSDPFCPILRRAYTFNNLHICPYQILLASHTTLIKKKKKRLMRNMNTPASLLSENYKSMQEHDDKIILNENNTSIIQAQEMSPLMLWSQNTQADFLGTNRTANLSLHGYPERLSVTFVKLSGGELPL